MEIVWLIGAVEQSKEITAVGWTLAAIGWLWGQRQAIRTLVASAMRDAEKQARLEAIPLEGERLNLWLEAACVAFFRRSRWLRWVPEILVRTTIRDLADRAKRSKGSG